MRVIESARRAYRSFVTAIRKIASFPRQIPSVWTKYRRRVGLWLAFAFSIFVLSILLAGLALVILIPITAPQIFGGRGAAALTVTLGPLAALLLAWKLSPRMQALIRRLFQRNHTA